MSSNTVISSTSSGFTLILSALLLHETLTLTKVACVILSMAGVILVTTADGASGGKKPHSAGPGSGSSGLNFTALSPAVLVGDAPQAPPYTPGGDPPSPVTPTEVNHALGDVLSLCAALLFAIYSVLIKWLIPSEKNLRMPMFFGFSERSQLSAALRLSRRTHAREHAHTRHGPTRRPRHAFRERRDHTDPSIHFRTETRCFISSAPRCLSEPVSPTPMTLAMKLMTPQFPCPSAGIFSALMCLPLLAILHFSGVERMEVLPYRVALYCVHPSHQCPSFHPLTENISPVSSNRQLTASPPFAVTANGMIGTVLSDLLWAKAIVLTSPLTVNLGMSFTIPLSCVADSWLGVAPQVRHLL